ncbi:MAG: twin-arginine translocase TatA/TatE family subunit [Planctomycetaceae bacterium]|jgi:Sec-independent protein translocase protein TatA|nr:twin-arginine translocase TatA/TatE family subunit [Planctomycetaceae bacterium]
MTQPLAVLMLLALGVLLYGKRLPEIARQIGQGLLEFKNGISEATSSRNQSTKTKKQDTERWELEKRETVSECFMLPVEEKTEQTTE